MYVYVDFDFDANVDVDVDVDVNYLYHTATRRFGFANLDALEAGQTGTECRGEEHDVTIVWSITSGKRLVLADGKEVHFSHSRNNIFDFSWTMRGNHVLKIVAHAQPPLSAQPGFRQYDFFVDGQSFFTFPKVFRLGLAPSDPRGGRSNSGGGSSSLNQSQQNMETTGRRVVPSEYNNYEASDGGGQSLVPYVTAGGGGGGGGRSVNSNNIVSIEAPHNTEEEDAYLRQAIENSLKEAPSPNRASVTSSVGGSAPPASEAGTLLLDFMTPPTSAVPSGPADPVLALPPSTSLYASDMFGQQPAFAALPPSTTTTTATSIASNTTSTNAPFPPEQQQQQQQQQLDPWGMASVAAALPPSQPPTTQEYDLTYGGGPQHVPTPVSNPFGGTAALTVPETNLSFGSPPPTSITGPSQEEFTPATLASSIGFASPMMAQTLEAQGQQQQQQQQLGVTGIFEQHEPNQQQQSTEAGAGAGAGADADAGAGADASNAELAAAPPSDPALLSMNVLSGQPQSLVTESMINGGAGQAVGSSMADQAYAKLVNMDAFDLVQDKDTESRKNPFDVESTTSTTIGGGNNNNNKNASLADMMMSKKPTEKKEVMKNHAGALVLSNSQQGNFGGYGVQHQQPQQMQGYGSLLQQNNYSQPPLQQYGQQQAYGSIQQQTAPVPPPMQQQYEQPPVMQQQQQQPYGQPVPMQQQQQYPYGQPLPMQQQQTYGQPAPTSQQPFGF